jgi:hypothetical protein
MMLDLIKYLLYWYIDVNGILWCKVGYIYFKSRDSVQFVLMEV